MNILRQPKSVGRASCYLLAIHMIAIAVCGGCISKQALNTAILKCANGTDPDACTQLLKQNTDSPAAIAATTVSRGVAYSQTKPPQHDKAIADYTTVINMQDAKPIDHARALYNRALEYRRMNPDRLADAIDDLTAAINIPNTPTLLQTSALNNRGFLYANLEPENWQQAIDDHTTVINMTDTSPDQLAMAYINRAEAYRIGRQQLYEAVTDLTTAISIDEAPLALRAKAHIARGDTYVSMQPPQLEQAVTDFTTVIEMKAEPWQQVQRINLDSNGHLISNDDFSSGGFITIHAKGLVPVSSDQRMLALCRRSEAYARMQPPRLDEAIADCTAVIDVVETSLDLRLEAYHQRAKLHDQANALGPAAMDHVKSIYGKYLDSRIEFCRRRASNSKDVRTLAHAIREMHATRTDKSRTLHKFANICDQIALPKSAAVLRTPLDEPIEDEWR